MSLFVRFLALMLALIAVLAREPYWLAMAGVVALLDIGSNLDRRR